MAVPLLAIYGTGGGDFDLDGQCSNPIEHWWHVTSAWFRFMTKLGYEPFRSDREFHWSGDIDGLGGMWRYVLFWRCWMRKYDRPQHRDWYSAARHLVDYINGRGDRFFLTVAHSHAGQVALYAAAMGVKFPVLVTVGTPSRHDMRSIEDKAIENIGLWVEVFDAEKDMIAIGGQLGDGAISSDRTHRHSHIKIPLVDVSHSRILRDEDKFEHWMIDVLPNIPSVVIQR